MKDLTRSLLTFVLIYGTKDKARFRRHALSVMEPYPIDEHQKTELIDFAYDFFRDMGERMNSIDVISRGVRSGVSDLEDRLSAILDKLETVHAKMENSSSGTDQIRKTSDSSNE